MSGRALLRARAPLGVCVLALLRLGGGCQQQPAPAPAAHQVRYALAWARDDVTELPGRAGWTVTNDLGYVVRVTRGWVTSYSMELVECPKEAVTSRAARLGALAWSALEGEAWAGHATGTPNPAAIRPMQVESLLDPVDREVGAVTLAPQSYCKLHYLLARAGREAAGLPSEVDMVDISLHLDGSYRAPGASADTPLSIHTAMAYGALFEQAAGRGATALHIDTGVRGARVAVRRRRGRMFDGVDFAHTTERAVALQVLRSLVDHADVEVTAGDEAR